LIEKKIKTDSEKFDSFLQLRSLIILDIQAAIDFPTPLEVGQTIYLA
jgi:hypothetical protein